MLETDKTLERKERHHITQEDFTPNEIVDMMFDKLPEDTFSNLSNTILDPSCGIGNILVVALRRKLLHCNNIDDAIIALKSIYGIEYIADNVEECRNNIYNTVIEKFPSIASDDDLDFAVRAIIRNRIQWHDTMKFNQNHWPDLYTKKRKKHEHISFKEMRRKNDTKYPMWYKGTPSLF